MYLSFYKLTLLAVFVSTVDYRFLGKSTGIPSVTLTEIILYCMLLLYLGKAISGRFDFTVDISMYRKNKIIFIYFGWAALASICGLIMRSSAEGLEMFKNMFPSAIIYFFIVKFLVVPKQVKSLLWAYFTGILVNVILCLSQIFFNGPRPMKIEDAIASKVDFSGQIVSKMATGFFNHPNGLAMLLLPAIILVVSVIVFRELPGILPTFWALVILSIFIFTLKYTYAKGVYAWAAIGCALLFIPERFNPWRFGIGVFTLITFIVGITLYSLSTIISDGPNSLSTIITRIYLWLAAIEVIRSDHFIQLFGNGFKAMTLASNDIANWEYPNAHNGIINQALFYGIPALILYMWVFFATILRLAKFIVNADRTSKAIANFIFAALIALFGEYFFEPANVGVTLQTHFFVLIALSTVLFSSVDVPAPPSNVCRTTA